MNNIISKAQFVCREFISIEEEANKILLHVFNMNKPQILLITYSLHPKNTELSKSEETMFLQSIDYFNEVCASWLSRTSTSNPTMISQNIFNDGLWAGKYPLNELFELRFEFLEYKKDKWV